MSNSSISVFHAPVLCTSTQIAYKDSDKFLDMQLECRSDSPLWGNAHLFSLILLKIFNKCIPFQLISNITGCQWYTLLVKVLPLWKCISAGASPISSSMLDIYFFMRRSNILIWLDFTISVQMTKIQAMHNSKHPCKKSKKGKKKNACW
jgi:hypothetical protein